MATYRYTNIINDTQLMITTQRIATRKLRQVMEFTQDTAQRLVTGGEYSTGRLRESIEKLGPFPKGWQTQGYVIANPAIAPHAVIVERGARIHSIFPKSAPFVWRFFNHKRPQLRFVWNGRVVFTPHVPMSPHTVGRSHPGTKAQRYMRKAAAATALRYKMELIVYPT